MQSQASHARGPSQEHQPEDLMAKIAGRLARSVIWIVGLPRYEHDDIRQELYIALWRRSRYFEALKDPKGPKVKSSPSQKKSWTHLRRRRVYMQ